jgi:threonine/homoserine/homoserine lactone efflux protein
MSEFITALPFSLLLAISTGPVFFVIIETSISNGIKRALFVDIGAILADVVFILIASFGATAILQQLEGNPRWYLLGGVVLFMYGITSFARTNKNKNQLVFHSEELPQGNLFFYTLKGFLLNIINIGTFLFWLGLTVVFGTKYAMDDGKLNRFFVFVLIGYLIIDVLKMYLAKQLKNKLTPIVIYKLKQSVHFILMFFGLVFVFQGTFPDQKEIALMWWEQLWK